MGGEGDALQAAAAIGPVSERMAVGLPYKMLEQDVSGFIDT
jgi:hypothetical protein